MAISKRGTENTCLQIYYSDCYEICPAKLGLGAVGGHDRVIKDLDQVGNDAKRRA